MPLILAGVAQPVRVRARIAKRVIGMYLGTVVSPDLLPAGLFGRRLLIRRLGGWATHGGAALFRIRLYLVLIHCRG